MIWQGRKLGAVLFTVLFANSASAISVDNGRELFDRYRMDLYPDSEHVGTIKIAVLDVGFESFEPGTGQLPASAELIEGKKNALAPTLHGLGMAALVWAMHDRDPE